MSATQLISQSGFYVVGGTLRRDAPSYVVREADRRLYTALRQGEVCYALTPRQMGKSSLMVRTAARFRDDGANVAVLDLTGFGQNVTPDQWYNGLLERVGQQMLLEDQLEEYWNCHQHLGPLQRWTGAIREVVLTARSSQVLIFIDEIDAVRSLPFSTDEFFAGIREFYNRRTQDSELGRLTFCLLGVATPSDLIRDTRTTPFNIGRRIELADFTPEEAAPLAQGLGRVPKQMEPLISRVLYWTGGHPYLTQRLCQAVVEDGAETPSGVDQVCRELFLSNRARERDDNLLFVRERLLRNENDIAGLLNLYGRVRSGKRVRDDETNSLNTILRLSGITKLEDGCLRVRNRIYAEVFDRDWIASHLPGDELRRQKAAYVRGLKIASAVSAPLILLALILPLFRENSAVAPPVLPFAPPAPPAFWASFNPQAFPSANIGALLIRAGEEGITVFVNNMQYGTTGSHGVLQIPVLQAGNYEIRLEKEGFQSVSQRAEIAGERETRLFFTLQPKTQVLMDYALIVQNAVPGTRVSVDGKLMGSAKEDGTSAFKVTPGEHEIALEREGYLPRKFRQEFRPGNSVVDGKLAVDAEARDWALLADMGDVNALENYLVLYPNGRFAAQARSRAEDLDWAKVKDSNDLVALDGFLKKYPRGRFSADASADIEQLQQEDLDWRTAQLSKDPSVVQKFIDQHPHSRHAEEAQTAILVFKDQRAIRQLLKQYENSYNRQDLTQLLNLWPFCPPGVQSVLRAQFKSSQSGTLALSPVGDPNITGELASLTVLRVRRTETATTSGNVPFKFRKQYQRWVIESGVF